jgi:hypothetical protein
MELCGRHPAVRFRPLKQQLVRLKHRRTWGRCTAQATEVQLTGSVEQIATKPVAVPLVGGSSLPCAVLAQPSVFLALVALPPFLAPPTPAAWSTSPYTEGASDRSGRAGAAETPTPRLPVRVLLTKKAFPHFLWLHSTCYLGKHIRGVKMHLAQIVADQVMIDVNNCWPIKVGQPYPAAIHGRGGGGRPLPMHPAAAQRLESHEGNHISKGCRHETAKV